MIDPNIALGVRPINLEGPMDAYQQAMGLKTMANQQQLQQAQLTGAQQENQMRQIQIDQTQKLNNIYRNAFTAPADGSAPQLDVNKLQRDMAQAGLGSRIPEAMQHYTEYQKSLTDLASSQNQLAERQADSAGMLGLSIKKAGYDPHLALAGMQDAINAKAVNPQALQPVIGVLQQAFQQDPTGQSARQFVQKFADSAIARSPKAQEAIKNQTQADLAAAQIPGAKAKSQAEQLKADLQQQAIAEFKANPQAGGEIIDRVLPSSLDAPANASYKAAWQSAMQTGGPDAAQKIVEAAAAHAGEISKDLNPAIRQAHVQQAVDTETATAPIKVNEQVQTEIEKAKRAPGAFSSVLDPAARTKAIADFQKSSDEYADKMGAAKQLQDFVSAAQSGNKVAPGLIPIAEVKQLLNRVNRNELQSVSSSAGSAYDRLQGFFNKWTDGQPIPPAVLRDTATIANVMANAAQRTYQNKVAINRQVYGSKAQPVTLPGSQTSAAVPAAVASALKSVGPGIHTLSDGSVWMKAADGSISKQ